METFLVIWENFKTIIPEVPNREDLPDSDSDSSSDAEWTVEHFAHCEINQYVWTLKIKIIVNISIYLDIVQLF